MLVSVAQTFQYQFTVFARVICAGLFNLNRSWGFPQPLSLSPKEGIMTFQNAITFQEIADIIERSGETPSTNQPHLANYDTGFYDEITTYNQGEIGWADCDPVAIAWWEEPKQNIQVMERQERE